MVIVQEAEEKNIEASLSTFTFSNLVSYIMLR